MNILVAGDFCPKERIAPLLEKDDFASLFGEVKDIITQADYSIVNFECPVTKGDEKPIAKLGPNLHCSEKGMESIKWVGFNCVTLANNHFYDFGEEGVTHTLDVCNKFGMDTVGGGKNIEEASGILYKQVGRQTLAIINCCEHEFSIATDNTGGSNPLNPIQQYYSIIEAKSKADNVLVIVHGGHEHWQLPSPRMVETYRFFIDAGADAVVNHHQHCFSGYEVYNGKPIFYGLGNFCFDINPPQRNSIWNYGYLLKLNFSSIGVDYELFPYYQCGEQVGVKMLPKNAFSEKLKELNTIISDKKKLIEATDVYYGECAKQCSNIFEPFRNRYYLALKQRGLLSSLISKKRKLHAGNYICCEAHRDKVIWYLNH